MPVSNAGYSDLLIGAHGFEFSVWRWNGNEYALYKTIKDSGLEKIKVREIEDLSKEYTQTLKN